MLTVALFLVTVLVPTVANCISTNVALSYLMSFFMQYDSEMKLCVAPVSNNIFAGFPLIEPSNSSNLFSLSSLCIVAFRISRGFGQYWHRTEHLIGPRG